VGRSDASKDGLTRILGDASAAGARRVSAARELATCDDRRVLESLINVAQDQTAPPDLAAAVGWSLAQICARRERDLDDLVLANLSENADRAYDGEIARLERQNPALKMRRGKIGSGY